MDIHKPKPFHGLRAFLKEYGIIVLGVLTALAAEQAVGALHERHMAAEARDNIKDELATDIASLGNRQALEPCVARRLDELEAAIDGAGKPGHVAPTWVGRPQYWPMFEAKWQAATSAGRATLLSAEEQARYGQLYQTLRLLGDAEIQEQTAWAHLRTLETARDLNPALAAQQRLALSEARLTDWQIVLYTARGIDLSRGMGLAHPPAQHRGTRSVCLPITTLRAAAIAQTRQQAGDNRSEP